MAVDEISFHKKDLQSCAWCKRDEWYCVKVPWYLKSMVQCHLHANHRQFARFCMVRRSGKSVDVLAFFQKLHTAGIRCIVCDNAAIH